MQNEPMMDWEPAYRQAYELAKQGNPVVQTAVARACFQHETHVLGPEEAFELVKDAATDGFPPALLIQGLLAMWEGHSLLDPEEAEDALFMAEAEGCGEAVFVTAVMRFLQSDLTAEELLEVLCDGRPCITGIVCLAIERLIQEMRRAEKLVHVRDEKIAELIQHAANAQTKHREQVHARNARISNAETEKVALSKKVDSLSSSSLGKERDALRAELTAIRQRLADAEAVIANADRLSDSKVEQAVEETNRHLGQAQFDRELANEERDEAIRKSGKSDRRTKRLEAFIRKHGLEPLHAFTGEDAVPGTFEDGLQQPVAGKLTGTREQSRVEVTV